LADENGFRLTRRIKKEHPNTRIAIVNGHDLPEQMSLRRFLKMLKAEACLSDNLKKTRQKYLFQGV
jgi:hypothetical protein